MNKINTIIIIEVWAPWAEDRVFFGVDCMRFFRWCICYIPCMWDAINCGSNEIATISWCCEEEKNSRHLNFSCSAQTFFLFFSIIFILFLWVVRGYCGPSVNVLGLCVFFNFICLHFRINCSINWYFALRQGRIKTKLQKKYYIAK